MAGTADYQEEVLSNLLDLQAELRGEAHHQGTPAAADDADGASPSVDGVAVATSGLEVRVAPSSVAVADRLAALNARLAKLEADLARVGKRIDEVEPDTEVVPEPAADADAPWRSFLDLQKIVADRLDGR